MKRIKIFFSALLSLISALLCFALVGCANKDGEYLPDSLDYRFYVYQSSMRISTSYSFDVTMPGKVNYEVKYTVVVYYNDIQIHSQYETETISPNQNTTRTISDYYSFDYALASNMYESGLTLEITDVTVTPKEQNDKYQNYAIGFGTVGGAVLIACTVLFIVLKVKEKK